ncbi:MAG: hypothetical protein LC104_03765, partial [Bacteroidales bacterium]|nr:hypothetical protein [Bacteroidales bacterium]
MTKSTASSDGPSPDEPALIGKWVNRLTRVTGKREQVKCLTMLARHVRSETGRLAVLEQLARREPNGARLALMFLSRLPERLPATLISQVIPLLQDDRISSTIRITAAGLCLEAVPDRAAHVQPILSAITHGLPRTQILERLIRLQKRVQNCQTLDQTIEQTEQQIHYRCSSCKRSFPRRQFIQHLWVQHRLTFQRGRILEPQPIVEQAINAASQSGAVDDLDRAFALSRMYYPDVPIYQVLQAIAARSPADPSQLDRLREVAAAQAAGLCPICLTALPDPIPRLPPPLSLSAHRLAGDGYAVEVMMRNGVRSITIRTPTEEWFPSQSFSRWPGRTIGAMVATFILVIAIFFTLVIPGDSWALWVVACGMVGWAWLGYAAARWLVPALPEARAEAVRLAWEKFVPGIGRRPPAVRFLIRLCRSSLGEGHVRERVAVVGEMVEQAAILADKGPLYLQFLAAVRVLQVYDAAVLGRDRVSGLAALFEPIFRGEISPIFAEAVAELLLDPPGLLRHGERGRLAVLLLHSAF